MSNTTQNVAGQGPYEPLNPNHPRLALKHGAGFLLMNTDGMMPGASAQGFGFYHDDTRWLRRWELTVAGKPLFMLNADVASGYAGSFVYSNEADPLPAQNLMVTRDIVINDGFTERVRVTNFSPKTVDLDVSLHFDNDFADMFEVRGTKRKLRGTSHAVKISRDRRRATLSYTGLDQIQRETAIDFLKLRPTTLESNKATFRLKLKRRETRELLLQISTRIGGGELAIPSPSVTFAQERAVADARFHGWMESTARIRTENADFNVVLDRAYNDLYILRQRSKQGFALAAGVPWFAVPFGRDDFITALQTVNFMPELAREILTFFAQYQGKKYNDELCEEPGKMPHEIRTGEMANCAEIAFRPYYGTVDATQLWLMLLDKYVRVTGDLDLARDLWENARLADKFLTYATRSGGSYITYGGKPGQALSNQGWKDSGNSIVYSDGELAKAPIAVCEAQGYAYAAFMGMSQLAGLLDHPWYSQECYAKAQILKRRFGEDFWMEDKQFVALALDADGRQCDVISSNPGHLLGTGILSPERERIVADRLMQSDMFNGWGIRTLSSDEFAYQPLDYQLGSVWPHDTGYTVANMPAIDRAANAHKIMRGLFDAARCMPDARLPELFCGFDRVGTTTPPVKYPVACIPQAWAAGTWFHMLGGCMNIKADALNNRATIAKPALPEWLGKVTVTGLRVAESELDLEFTPDGRGNSKCRVTKVSGDIDCAIE